MIISEYNYIILYIYTEVPYNVSHFCLHLAYFSWPSSSSPAALSLSRAGSLYGVSGHSQRVLPVSHRLLTQRNCFAGETTWNYIIYSTILSYGSGWWFGTFFIFHNIWDNPFH